MALMFPTQGRPLVYTSPALPYPSDRFDALYGALRRYYGHYGG